MVKIFTIILIISAWLMPGSFALAQEAPTTEKPQENQATTDPAQAKPAFCPAEAPAAGPSEGQDYQQEIARRFIQEIKDSGFRDPGELGSKPDTKSEQIVIEIAKRYAPGADGKTRYKYSIDGDGPSSFDCSGFVHSVLKQAKAAGANVLLGNQSFTGSYTGVGRLVDKVDLRTNSRGGAKQRTSIDLPEENKLRPGDLIFFGTSTACSNDKNCPNEVGHMGIYLGNGQYIHSTSSDEDPNRDSASKTNDSIEPPIKGHGEGAKYRDYNGVKISNLSKSYFTPGFYIMVRRVIPETLSAGIFGTVEGLGQTTFPGGKDAYISFRTCHGSTHCYPDEKPGHGAYKNRPDGDALDITPRDGYGIAVFSGTASSGGSGRHSYTVLTSQNGRVKAYYYHTSNLKEGRVQAGEKIVRTGVAGIHHAHFELLVDGKSVHGNLVYNSRTAEGQRAYQKSLWSTMKMVLGLI